jgi:hypothetical protein
MMKHLVWRTGALTAIACAATIAAAAHTSGSTQDRSPGAADKVTITGCVRSADSKPVGTSGTVGNTSDSKFILTDVIASDAAKSTAAATGAITPATASDAGSYRLDADDSKLSPHLGHKVEISGTVEAPSTSSPAATSAASAATTLAPRLKVDTVKMIGSTCSE